MGSALLERVLPALRPEITVVLDAFALAHVGKHPDCLNALAGNAVLTPNTKELALMTGEDRGAVEDDAAGTALRAAATLRAVVSAGGSESWIASPDGDRIAARTGRLGYLAREVIAEVPLVLSEIEA